MSDDFGADWEANDRTIPFSAIRYDAQGQPQAFNSQTKAKEPLPLPPAGMTYYPTAGSEPGPSRLSSVTRLRPALLRRLAARSQK